MAIVTAVLLAVLLAVMFMTGVFVIGKRLQRYDVVDVAWGPVFIMIAIGVLMNYSLMDMSSIWWGKVLITLLVIIWGMRLATHIGRRFVRSQHEDRRYVELRAHWRGNIAHAVYVRIYVVQALLAVVIALPVIVINSSMGAVMPVFLLVGTIIWLIGFVWESVGDAQLAAFRTRHKGKLMTEGLWKYSRHPNYFGEMTQWWGIGVMALSITYGWIGLIGPLVLTYLLLFVSGVPLAEKGAALRPGWREYKRRTSVVFPLPPKQQQHVL